MDSTNSDFDKLYNALHIRHTEEIVPSKAVKTRLDKALKAKKRKFTFFELRIPLYQSIAAAVIFFIIGLGISFMQPTKTRIVHTTTQVIKYRDRPVKEIQYIKVPVQIRKTKEENNHQGTKAIPVNNMVNENSFEQEETSAELFPKHEIAMTDTNESKGISIGSDTVLQKMLVMIH